MIEHPTEETPSPTADPHVLRKHSVSIDGHQTSITLENAFWWRFCAIARSKNISLNKLIGEIDHVRTRTHAGNLSSAIRVFVLEQATGEHGLTSSGAARS
ncbi:ribbon-helix-helix domain-containing protein [Varunaivibrio sulfuroxidans]|uniref:Putative DNA-binding ribbon-helix-helix protein n=1 Tax=Varunaivibrio sulfuroxidans TaxID=1773489 RepID=A0A4R3J6G3_9PROT|nr:ribbon-helix-helix domain-containing protein [Varunaivibrio sulfuroxidans]TCS60967.1 putative DNA-binding ribbon-helix-helix protein [Varunaivibrio sulfuroxidans]WES31626.1 ribbon-helix-helix domain-containing protein [Varunaivibrio sulfuroxidans]